MQYSFLKCIKPFLEKHVHGNNTRRELSVILMFFGYISVVPTAFVWGRVLPCSLGWLWSPDTLMSTSQVWEIPGVCQFAQLHVSLLYVSVVCPGIQVNNHPHGQVFPPWPCRCKTGSKWGFDSESPSTSPRKDFWSNINKFLQIQRASRPQRRQQDPFKMFRMTEF